jgi:hypothetical protein
MGRIRAGVLEHGFAAPMREAGLVSAWHAPIRFANTSYQGFRLDVEARIEKYLPARLAGKLSDAITPQSTSAK